MTPPIQPNDSTYIVQASDSTRVFTEQERITAHRTDTLFNTSNLDLEPGDTLVIKNGKAKTAATTGVTVSTGDAKTIAKQEANANANASAEPVPTGKIENLPKKIENGTFGGIIGTSAALIVGKACAAKGGALGSALGPWGTVGGAVVGFLFGFAIGWKLSK